jgi:ribonucleotide reductase beta subunit family protein with ferritin-like domain
MINILKPKEEYVIEYPEALEFAKKQVGIIWTPDEVSVEKDIHDLKTNFTESEYHGIVSVLRLFTLYEVRVGDDYWKEYIGTLFKRPEFERLSATFSFMELGVHAPFYNRINELLGLDTDEFYQDYLNDPVLSDRMKWLGKRVVKKETHFDILKSIGIFSMIEGAILFSSFAFIKHFNSNGKNKLSNVNAGINFSANDENIHSEAGAWIFRTMLQEVLASNPTFVKTFLKEDLYETANTIRDHELSIIKKIFDKGHIDGITPTQLINFVESRLDICLNNLGYEAIFKPSYNPIAKWFYNDLNSSTLHDFFVTQGNDYNRNWDSRRFVW